MHEAACLNLSRSRESRRFLLVPDKTVEVNGVWIALFNVDGSFFAVDNTCPHAGGPIGEGHLTGEVVDMSVARMAIQRPHRRADGNPNFTVACCPVRVEGNQVQIALPPDFK